VDSTVLDFFYFLFFRVSLINLFIYFGNSQSNESITIFNYYFLKK